MSDCGSTSVTLQWFFSLFESLWVNLSHHDEHDDDGVDDDDDDNDDDDNDTYGDVYMMMMKTRCYLSMWNCFCSWNVPQVTGGTSVSCQKTDDPPSDNDENGEICQVESPLCVSLVSIIS